MASSPVHLQLHGGSKGNRETAAVKAAWSLKTDQWSAEADLITMTCPKCPLQIVPSCIWLCLKMLG